MSNTHGKILFVTINQKPTIYRLSSHIQKHIRNVKTYFKEEKNKNDLILLFALKYREKIRQPIQFLESANSISVLSSLCVECKVFLLHKRDFNRPLGFDALGRMSEPTPGGTPQLGKPPDLDSANMSQPGFEPKTSHREVKGETDVLHHPLLEVTVELAVDTEAAVVAVTEVRWRRRWIRDQRFRY
ncbi:hypothetical protein R6Q59_015992 [Mikania micrantha]